jgi:hypothetical protein
MSSPDLGDDGRWQATMVQPAGLLQLEVGRDIPDPYPLSPTARVRGDRRGRLLRTQSTKAETLGGATGRGAGGGGVARTRSL